MNGSSVRFRQAAPTSKAPSDHGRGLFAELRAVVRKISARVDEVEERTKDVGRS
jgi:hypothetical protein